ncbi:hypothetical protein AC249_AIPGENE27043 [Exaiptasia diaphana]|nr:hypothetical protein AC249_AIPGENE27043 [Exaiptasia diaphana]
MWRPWEAIDGTSTNSTTSGGAQASQLKPVVTKTVRVRAASSEREGKLVSESFNLVCDKDWSAVADMARKRVLDYGLPPRVIKIYMESDDNKLITRMKNVLRKTTPSSSSTSSTTTTTKTDDKMRYAVKRTPAQRKLESKLNATFIASSSSSDEEQEEKKKKKKTATEVAREAQEAHTTMCRKAMETLEKVGSLLTKVESQIDKSAKP